MRIKIDFVDSLREELLILYSTFFCPKLYTSIHDEGSAAIWDDIHKDQDFTLLIKDPKKRKAIWLSSYTVADAWEKMYDEFLANFPPKKYYKDLATRTKIAIMRNEAIVNNERSKNTLANLEEAKLDSKTVGKGSEYEKNVVMIQKRMGFKLNSQKMTIFEYHNYLKSLS